MCQIIFGGYVTKLRKCIANLHRTSCSDYRHLLMSCRFNYESLECFLDWFLMYKVGWEIVVVERNNKESKSDGSWSLSIVFWKIFRGAMPKSLKSHEPSRSGEFFVKHLFLIDVLLVWIVKTLCVLITTYDASYAYLVWSSGTEAHAGFISGLQ